MERMNMLKESVSTFKIKSMKSMGSFLLKKKEEEDTKEEEELEETMPLYGVSLKFLITKFHSLFTNNQTFEAVRDEIRATTENMKGFDRSYASFLHSHSETRSVVKATADCFVTYTWKSSWAETMNALISNFKAEDDVFVWMDVICMDQHKVHDINFKKFSRIFETNLREIGRAAIVVTPSHKPSILHRLWCYFEIVHILQANIPYYICISSGDHRRFIHDMEKGKIAFTQFQDIFNLVNCEKAMASKNHDLMEISHHLNKEIGVETCNFMVLDAIKNLYVTMAIEAEKQMCLETRSLVRVLNTRSDLHEALGEYDVALPYCEKSLVYARSIPDNEEQIATQMNNLAELYHSMGQVEQAETLQMQAIEEIKKFFGEDAYNPLMATALNNLAELLRERGEFDQAKVMYEQSIEIFSKIFGNDSPYLAGPLNNLAMMLSEEQKMEEYEPLHERLLALQKKKIPGKDEEKISALKALANLSLTKGEYDEAEKIQRQIITMRKRGDTNHHLNELNDLAITVTLKGELEEAEEILKTILEIRKKNLTTDTVEYGTTLSDLGLIQKKRGKLELAKSSFEQAIASWRESCGVDHPLVSLGLTNLAELYTIQKKFELAEKTYEQILEIDKKNYGEDHPTVSNDLNNLARAIMSQGDDLEAERLARKAMSIDKRIFKTTEYPEISSDANNLGMLLMNQGKYDEAKPFFEQSLKIRQQVLGEDHLEVARSLNNLACLLRKRGNVEEAKELGKQAYAIALKNHDQELEVVFKYWETI